MTERTELERLELRLVLSSGLSGSALPLQAADATAEIQGAVFNDRNAKGQRESGDENLPGWQVYLDLNNDGQLDIATTTTVSSADVPKPIPDVSSVTSSLIAGGLAGRIGDVNVTLNITHTYDSDLRAVLVSPTGVQVPLFTHVGTSGHNFTGTVLDDQATTPISSGRAPFTGSYKPQGSLAALNGLDPNGTWQLQVFDDGAGDVGTLNNWSLTFGLTEPLATTDASGAYTFANLQPGSYVVREIVQTGWTQTFPAGGAAQTVTVGAGQVVGNVDFGDHASLVPLQYQVVSPSDAGDCKMTGDFDGDGFNDLAVGGGTDLVWYKYPNWTPTVIAPAAAEFTTDGETADINGDGGLDIIIPEGGTGSNLFWFQNPLPTGNPTVGSQWVQHVIGSAGGFVHDIRIADYDGNGLLDVAARNTHSQDMIFFQTAPDTWTQMILNVSAAVVGSDGLGSGDVNRDGKPDLVLLGSWLENPGGLAARTPSNWKMHLFGNMNSASFKAVVTDINGDGKSDIVTCSAEGTDDIAWWTPATSDYTGTWVKHVIAPSVYRCHTLQVGDMNNDGHMDVVAGQMNTTTTKEVDLFLNADGLGTTWTKQVVATTGTHNGQLVDIGNDGDLDIFGSNYNGSAPAPIPVELWINQTSPPIPALSASPLTGASIDFGKLHPYTGTAGPVTLPGAVTLSNTGGAASVLTITAAVTGASARLFHVSNPGLPGLLTAGGAFASQAYDLLFDGGAPGVYSATVTFTADNGQSAAYPVRAAVLYQGDANEDGTVSFADYIVLANNFGQSGGWTAGDFNGDGTVSFADYILLANNFGQTIPS